MLRILLMIALLAALPQSLLADSSVQILAAHTLLNNGNPEQAVIMARRLLKNAVLSTPERMALLSTIARAETMRTTHQHFQQVHSAIDAIEAVLNEFPDSPDAAEFRWQRAWLWWKSGNYQKTIASTREMIAQDQQERNLRRAWLLMTRAHLALKNYAYARSDLLQYGLHVHRRSREQAIGMAWMAIVDLGESRADTAYKSLHDIFRKWPTVLTSEAELFAAYIDQLHSHQQMTDAQKLAAEFLHQYTENPQAAGVRLIQANIHAMQAATIDLAIKEYTILSQQQAETSIGRKAFMRKLMLENRDVRAKDELLPAMVALKKIADTNQLSTIEDEAMLDLARLWTRIRITQSAQPATQATAASQIAPGLEAYARAASSLDPHIATVASQEGAIWLNKYTTLLLKQQQWLKAVNIWRQYPQLRPANHAALQLKLGIAHAMRMLMLFDTAESMLEHLYADNRMSINGQRIMMERAQLWLDRQDPAAIKKIMRWLNRHEFSIYRPDMLLIVARMQLQQGQADQARQTLVSVRMGDISPQGRATYWQAKAGIAEALSEWHRAASAWQAYRQLPDADKQAGLDHQAEDLFKAEEFAAALGLYQQMPKEEHQASWQYHVGVCQLRTGAIKQGSERLKTLAANGDAKRFAALAKLTLADQQAKKLLGATP